MTSYHKQDPAKTRIDVGMLERSHEALQAWKTELMESPDNIDNKYIIACIDKVAALQSAVLNRARLIGLFGQQVSRDMLDLIDILAEHSRDRKSLPPYAQRLVSKVTDMAREMKSESTDCIKQFTAYNEELTKLREDVFEHSNRLQKKIPQLKQDSQWWHKLSRFVMAIGAIAAAITTLVFFAPGVPIAMAVAPTVVTAASYLAKGFVDIKAQSASHAASMARLDQSLMKDIGRDLTEQVRTIGGMGAWWTRVRDDICALGVDEDVLTNYTQAELNSLRGRWQGMHNELKANAALLGFATNGESKIPLLRKTNDV